MKKLSRVELFRILGEFEFWPELRADLDRYLYQYIHSKDLEMVLLLLKAGASPDSKDGLDCYLHHLFHEYKVTRSLSGDITLSIMEALLHAGANPNRVWCNNYRAYDYAVEEGVYPVAQLLEKYGADKNPREYI